MLSQTGFHFYISHWDLDGIVAAALLVHTSRRLGLSYDYRLATPASLTRYVARVPQYSRLVVADLAPRPNDVAELKRHIAGMEKTVWIDHHEWPPRAVDELSKAGAVLVLDNSASTSASLLAHSYLTECCGVDLDDYDWLVQLANREDNESETSSEARRWRIVLRMSSWELRYRIVDSLAENPGWPQWLDEVYSRMSREYNRLMREALGRIIVMELGCGPVVAAISVPNKLHPGDVHAALARRVEADIYVIMYPGGVSLRSTAYDVSKLAEQLGGGGHAYAAGAPVEQGYEPQALLEKIAALAEKIYCQ